MRATGPPIKSGAVLLHFYIVRSNGGSMPA